jgi:hypothetical protein
MQDAVETALPKRPRGRPRKDDTTVYAPPSAAALKKARYMQRRRMGVAPKISGRPARDLTGQKFGNWTAIERGAMPNPSGAVPWRCVCADCSGEQWFEPNRLLRESTVPLCDGCGTSLRARGEANRQKKVESKSRYERTQIAFEERKVRILAGQLLLNSRWNKIVKGARTRNIEVAVTKADALAVFQAQGGRCALSGQAITLAVSNKDNGTASLDRIDSDKAYEAGNIQWVHKDVNFMKQDYDEDYFVEMCMKVAATRSPAAANDNPAHVVIKGKRVALAGHDLPKMVGYIGRAPRKRRPANDDRQLDLGLLSA